MPNFLDNVQGTLPHAAGFQDSANCPDCIDATEIMLQRCPEKSIGMALTSQSAKFGKDGKIVITDEYFDKLRSYSLNGKITPGNYRKIRRKEGNRQIYYYAQKRDAVAEHFGEEGCSPDFTRQLQKQADDFLGHMDDYFIQSHLCGTSKANTGCNDCGDLFRNIGNDDKPFTIEIEKTTTASSTSAFQATAEQFIQYLINIQAYGDNLPDNCDSQMYVVLNSCFAPLMSYLNNATKASCDNTCAMDQGIRPMTTESGLLPHVYFSKRVPMSNINGVRSSSVLAGYYGDDIIIPEPVFVERNKAGKHMEKWDYAFYAFQYANVRPDRKWIGNLELKEG